MYGYSWLSNLETRYGDVMCYKAAHGSFESCQKGQASTYLPYLLSWTQSGSATSEANCGCNISGKELRQFLEIAQGGGVLAKDPHHLWVSLSQGAGRLVGGMGGDEAIAFSTLVPVLFYKYYCKTDEGSRSLWRYCRDFLCGGPIERLYEPTPQIYRTAYPSHKSMLDGSLLQ